MSNRSKAFKRIKRGLWLKRGGFFPTYAYNVHKIGIEYQHYGLDANGGLVYAGVSRHEHLNQAQANQIHRVWLRWRKEYDSQPENVARDYPAKHINPVSTLVIVPCDKSAPAIGFRMSEVL